MGTQLHSTMGISAILISISVVSVSCQNNKNNDPDTRFIGPIGSAVGGLFSNPLIAAGGGFLGGLGVSHVSNSIGGGSSGVGACCCGRKKREAQEERLFGLGNSGCGCGGIGRRKRQTSNNKFFLGNSNSCNQCGSCGGSYNNNNQYNNYKPPQNSYNNNNYNSQPCRCSSQTSNAGENCRTPDKGGNWCYTQPGQDSGCGDLHTSNYSGYGPWSYQACNNNGK